MELYHGSDSIIRQPIYHGGRKHNDYGYGFYCTEDMDLAREWSVTKEHDGYLNSYVMETSGLRILDLEHDYSDLYWIAVLLQHRTFVADSPLAREAKAYLLREFSIDVEKYDLVCGYRADDSYFSYAQDFINGTISTRQLGEAMRLGKLGRQVVLKSPKAHESIQFKGAEPVDRKLWLARKERRDQAARKTYFQSDRMSFRKGEIYILQIIEEEMKADDPRLR